MTGRAALELDTLTIRIPIRLQRRGGQKLIMMPEGAAEPARKPSRDETLVKALVRAHRWRRRIERGQAKSITDVAGQEGVTVAYVCRLLPLTCLAPDIVEAVLDGRQPKELRLAELLGNRPLNWNEQRAHWGSPAIKADLQQGEPLRTEVLKLKQTGGEQSSRPPAPVCTEAAVVPWDGRIYPRETAQNAEWP